MGIAALVVGILAFLLSIFSGGFAWSGIMLGIVGIVLGVMGRNDPEQRGMATAGLVLSIIATSLGFLIFMTCVACVGLLGATGI